MFDVQLEKQLSDFRIDANFSSDAGITALFGRSGAGKTSIVNMLAGLLRPDRGRVAIGDAVLFDSAAGIDVAPEARRLGYVFQDARLFPHMSVARNLRFGTPRGHADPAMFDTVVGVLGLAELLTRRPDELSGGERQRVAIGRALLAQPRLLLMDEPLASLDMARRLEILPFVEAMHAEFAIPIVYVTHNIGEIIRLADDLALVANGHVVAFGPVEDMSRRPELADVIGRGDAGAVLRATVADHDVADQLSCLTFAGGTIMVPLLDAAVGETIRLRIRARDVALARERPHDTSVLNVFTGTISDLRDHGGAHVDVLINAGEEIWAQVTRRSARELALRPGLPIYAMVKSVSVDRQSLGGRLRRVGRT